MKQIGLEVIQGTPLYLLACDYFSLSGDWFNGYASEDEITEGLNSLYERAEAADILEEWSEWHTSEMEVMTRFYAMASRIKKLTEQLA